jgi:hypothetical protein
VDNARDVLGAANVTRSKFPDNLEIAPGYTVKCWKNLTLDSRQPDSTDWKKALQILDARISQRFLDPVDELIKADESRSRKTFGFAILAIDFLVIETLQGFREIAGVQRRCDRSLQTEQEVICEFSDAMECLHRLLTAG